MSVKHSEIAAASRAETGFAPCLVWRILSAVVFFSAVAMVACQADKSHETLSIAFTKIPPAAQGGRERLDTISGRVSGARPGQRIVVYAKSGPWWVQPWPDHPFIPIQSDSTWSTQTHLGYEYAALLVGPDYHPAPTIDVAPTMGGSVVALKTVNGVGSLPDLPTVPLRFSGYDWKVRTTDSARGGLNNLYDADNVWTDKSGVLHLRISNKPKGWTCAQLILARSLGNGIYNFVVSDTARLHRCERKGPPPEEHGSHHRRVRVSSLTILSEFRLRVGAAATAAAMLIFCAITSKAIDAHRMISQYAHDRWTIENEFPGGTTSAIAQTPDGYLWIGTEKGLFRFDGQTFRVFQQASPESWPIGPVQQLITDNRGNLWVLLANTKLLRFHDGKFELGHEEAEVGVTAIGKRANGAPLFASLAYGVLTYQDGKFLKISPPSDPNSTPTAPSSDDLSTRLSWATSVAAHHLAQPDSAVTSIAETSDGRVWLGTSDKGLFYLDRGRISPVRLPGESRNVRSLLPLENGELWIGTERGIFRWNGKEATQVGIDPAFREAEVNTMIRDRDANIWAGTTAGLARVNNDGASFDDVGSGRAKPVSALFEDREGQLWVGRSRGIEKLRETVFITYPSKTSQGESGGPVFVDATGRVWFASFKGGLQSLRHGQGA